MRLHVKEGYFFTPPKRVTSPTWGPPLPRKQAPSLTVFYRGLKHEHVTDFSGRNRLLNS